MFEGERVWVWEVREEGEMEFSGERQERREMRKWCGIIAVGEVVDVDYLRERGEVLARDRGWGESGGGELALTG